jgi:hypothetical protein
MKKIFLFLIVLFFASELSYGQFALGVRLGYTASKLTTNIDSIKSEFNNGFHAGIWARFGKRFYLSPEFLYNMSGSVFSSEGNLTTSGYKQKIKIGSIDIPVLVGLKIIHSNVITWRVEVGPEISLAVNKKVGDVEGVTAGITEDDINNATWYVVGGTGVDVLFLRLDLRYQYGLNALISDVQNSSLSSTNSLFLVSVGFKIFGGK